MQSLLSPRRRFARFFSLLPTPPYGISVVFSVCICYRLFNLIYLRATDDLYRLYELYNNNKSDNNKSNNKINDNNRKIARTTTLVQFARTLPLKWVTQLLSRLGHTPTCPFSKSRLVCLLFYFIALFCSATTRRLRQRLMVK